MVIGVNMLADKIDAEILQETQTGDDGSSVGQGCEQLFCLAVGLGQDKEHDAEVIGGQPGKTVGTTDPGSDLDWRQ